jgi:AAA ATPase domain
MTAVTSGSASQARGNARPLTPPSGGSGIRGRDAGWRGVGALLQRTRAGTGGVLLVDGERGMGKSLLLREARHAASAQGFLVGRLRG